MSAIAVRLLRRSQTRTNPVFYRDRLETLLSEQPDRFERLLHDPENVDLLTWNVFASLNTHSDRDWLAHRLEALGGSSVRAPLRLALWTGRDRGTPLEPSRGYVTALRERTAGAGGSPDAIAAFTEPVEAPVRIESPDVLCLVDTTLGSPRRGSGGRDRVLELIDAGLEQARRLSKDLAVATVYSSGTEGAKELSARMNQLRDDKVLGSELPHRRPVPKVALREMTWQQLLAVWEQEVGYLKLGGEPVRAFLDHVRELGLRA